MNKLEHDRAKAIEAIKNAKQFYVVASSMSINDVNNIVEGEKDEVGVISIVHTNPDHMGMFIALSCQEMPEIIKILDSTATHMNYLEGMITDQN